MSATLYEETTVGHSVTLPYFLMRVVSDGYRPKNMQTKINTIMDTCERRVSIFRFISSQLTSVEFQVVFSSS